MMLKMIFILKFIYDIGDFVSVSWFVFDKSIIFVD
jgi:hypothetical protein